ncbi:hypothetical protein [Alteromonas halophila]|uniref:Uncharacterized protein n=1 Tax=Alteromonas halophila TaxID=516698 RepID=A0A918JGN3_9ALTE|nr:hypothetical protein [Alteromonas halophila]GGW78993.1 hypothetical protein GCM10007391_09570 [Alteromonas halophila]
MKLRFLAIAAISLLLTACGGHGYEGTWKIGGGGMDKMLAMVGQSGTLIIGDDYVESSGQRTEFDIFVRESGDKKYLVMEDESGSEDVFEIVDEDTLMQNAGFVKLTLKRQ